MPLLAKMNERFNGCVAVGGADGCRLVAIMRSRMGVIADDSSSIYFGTLLRGDLFGIFCLILLLWSGGFGDDFE